jgi:hypothetical protein
MHDDRVGRLSANLAPPSMRPAATFRQRRSIAVVGRAYIGGLRLALGSVAPVFALIKAPLIEASSWGLLIAISALGLGTSLPAIAALGWRHVATVTGTTVVILVVVTAALMEMR